MNNLSIKEKLLTIKKGVYHHCVWKSEEDVNGDNYLKISSGSVRFIDYCKKHNKPKPLGYVETIVKTNKKGEEYTTFHTTGKMPKVSYYRNGEVITKEEYEMVIKPLNKPVSDMFSKHLSDILVLE